MVRGVKAMSKENKNWKKLADEQKPVEDKKFNRDEILKALIKIRRKRPMIRSSAT